MTPRRIGNPSRVPPFAGEVRVLLGLLVGRQPDDSAEPWLYGMVGVGWIESVRGGVAITEAGRDALACELLRGFAGPVVVVPEQPIMFADEARVMLAVVADLPPYTSAEPINHTSDLLDLCCALGWLDDDDHATDAGRDALAAYLLRGWRP